MSDAGPRVGPEFPQSDSAVQQVTREQGAFSWGLKMIQPNISAPCTVLDFPTREAFERELARCV